ncbi:hypothetical protein PAHAL_6G165500 [Panicum hallii]|uniref:Uncharacterized protein n=1 Tax=Panicum hallii TaxID=206008 RepID=A0A2T8IGG8_9POAL|nr:hypothetical protein PAHAL_6G165500 [Panicum hallii]
MQQILIWTLPSLSRKCGILHGMRLAVLSTSFEKMLLPLLLLVKCSFVHLY